MDNIYLYNDTFLSLLNLVRYLTLNNVKPYNIKSISYSPTLFDNLINLNLENKDIINNIINDVGKENFKILFYTFLSEENNKEIIIYYYYLNALKYKLKTIHMRNLKCVSEALRISKFVKHESHKFKGFVRFKELEKNILYAEIEPTNNIIYLISEHFKTRLKNEYWIIKDNVRKIYSVYNKKVNTSIGFYFAYICFQYEIMYFFTLKVILNFSQKNF